MTKEIVIKFVVEGIEIGSGTVFVENSATQTSSVEDSFYDTLRKHNKSWIIEAEEEEKSAIIDHLTSQQEDNLKEAHAKDYHGTDDDMPDAYEDWLTSLESVDLKSILGL